MTVQWRSNGEGGGKTPRAFIAYEILHKNFQRKEIKKYFRIKKNFVKNFWHPKDKKFDILFKDLGSGHEWGGKFLDPPREQVP